MRKEGMLFADFSVVTAYLVCTTLVCSGAGFIFGTAYIVAVR
jgi:hypothetical protein